MSKEQQLEFLQVKLHEIQQEFTKKQVEQVYQYYELLVEWNKVMNLTAITEWEEYVEKHIIDSILVKDIYDLEKVENAIDIGTGAGFPAIPLKIFYPHIRFTLLDALNKRIQFLNTVSNELGLENIHGIHGRAEDYGKDKMYREKYDLCVSRAVSELRILSEYCIPFVKMNGVFISYKSNATDDEIKVAKNAVNVLGGKIQNIVDIPLQYDDIMRRFVVIHKISITEDTYPRKAGKPQKKPL